MKAAGEMIVTKGFIKILTGRSGHYRPSEADLIYFATTMANRGVFDRRVIVMPGFGQSDWFRVDDWLRRGGTTGLTPLTDAEKNALIPARH